MGNDDNYFSNWNVGATTENNVSGDDLVNYYYQLHPKSFDNSSSTSNDDNLSDQVEEDKPNIPESSPPPEIEQLREWRQRIPQTDLDHLLDILRERLLPSLPKTSKTFLRTVDAKYNIIAMEDGKGGVGQFIYFGIKERLEVCINPEIHAVKIIELQVSADGVPLKKSSDE